MTLSQTVTQSVQAQLDAHAPGRYRVSATGIDREAEAAEWTVVSVDDGDHGAVFQLSSVVLEEQGEAAAADHLSSVILRVVGEGLPAKRAGAYVGYDAS